MTYWDAYASIFRVKHVLDGQDVGHLTPNDLPWISMYRQIRADSRAAVGSWQAGSIQFSRQRQRGD